MMAEQEECLPHQTDGRFDRELKECLQACGLISYVNAFTAAYLVRSCQDLVLLSKDELKTILTSAEADALRAELKLRKIEIISAKALVGEWVDIEGRGPGLIVQYKKVSNSLLYDSKHTVDLSVSGGSTRAPVLLRRRKLLRWNQGARFHLLDGKPSPQSVLQSMADEEASMHGFYQQRPPGGGAAYDDDDGPSIIAEQPIREDGEEDEVGSSIPRTLHAGSTTPTSTTTAAAGTSAAAYPSPGGGRTLFGGGRSQSRPRVSPQRAGGAHATTAAAISTTKDGVEEDGGGEGGGGGGGLSSEVATTLGPQFPAAVAALPVSDAALFASGFDVRTLVVELGSEAGVLPHAALRLARRHNFLRPRTGVSPPSSSSSSSSSSPSPSSSSPSPPPRHMCGEEEFVSWVNQVAVQYDPFNAYHSSLHAADVMLTANALLDASLQSLTGRRVDGGGSTAANDPWWHHRYALLLASAVHDTGHPARMNPFMVATKHPLTLQYSTTSQSQGGGVLEAMHAARFLASLQHVTNDVFSGCSDDGGGDESASSLKIVSPPPSSPYQLYGTRGALKRLVVELVLSTDLSQQGAILARWNDRRAATTSSTGDKVSTGGDEAGRGDSSSKEGKLSPDLIGALGLWRPPSTVRGEDGGGESNRSSSSRKEEEEEEEGRGKKQSTLAAAAMASVLADQWLLLKLVIKAADVSNPAKVLPLYLFWTERILEEFYDQGDEEKRLGLPVTAMPQCDRASPAVPQGQKGFIAFVVRPIFKALSDFTRAAAEAVVEVVAAAEAVVELEEAGAEVLEADEHQITGDEDSANPLLHAFGLGSEEVGGGVGEKQVQREEGGSGRGVEEDSEGREEEEEDGGKEECAALGAAVLWGTLEQIDANLAFWKEVEARVPPSSLARAVFPSDLPLTELAPEAMEAEVKGALALEARVEEEQKQEKVVVVKVKQEEPSSSSSSSVSSPSSNGNSAHAGSSDGGAEMESLLSENAVLASKLKEAEDTIRALQICSSKQSPPQPPTDVEGGGGSFSAQNNEKEDEEVEAAAAATGQSSSSKGIDDGAREEETVLFTSSDGTLHLSTAAAARAIVEANAAKPTPPSSSSSSSAKAVAAGAGGEGDYSNAKAVGDRIRALQSQISQLDQKDPNSQARFLHQPRGHRLEPMMNVEHDMRASTAAAVQGGSGAAAAAGGGSPLRHTVEVRATAGEGASSSAKIGGGGGGGEKGKEEEVTGSGSNLGSAGGSSNSYDLRHSMALGGRGGGARRVERTGMATTDGAVFSSKSAADAIAASRKGSKK